MTMTQFDSSGSITSLFMQAWKPLQSETPRFHSAYGANSS